MKKLFKLLFLFLLLSATGCAFFGTPIRTYPGTTDNSIDKTSLRTLGIPKGHLPPPGECRIWYPNRFTGDQPPPHKCTGDTNVPEGAWLIEHTNSKEIKVYFFECGAKDVRTYSTE